MSSTNLELDDPWRYCCPECGTHFESDMTRRVGSKEVRAGHVGVNDPDAPLYCGACRTALYGLLDKKTDEIVHFSCVDR